MSGDMLASLPFLGAWFVIVCLFSRSMVCVIVCLFSRSMVCYCLFVF